MVRTWRAEAGDVEGTAEYFDIPVAQVRAMLDYYADFQDEVDAEIAAEDEFARVEYERRERRRRALA